MEIVNSYSQRSTGLDLDQVRESCSFTVVNPTNGPSTGPYFIDVVSSQISDYNYVIQRAISGDTAQQHVRFFYNGTWSSWVGGVTEPSTTTVLSGSLPGFLPTEGVTLYLSALRGGNHPLPAFVQPTGRVDELMPAWFGKRLLMLQAPASGTTFTQSGFSAGPSSSGTTTQAGTIANTSRLKATSRVEFGTSTTPTHSANMTSNTANVLSRGSAAGQGGFTCSLVFGIVTKTTNALGFFGLRSSLTSVSGDVLANATNCIGVGWDAADANLSIIHNDASGAPTKVSLGTDFPTTADRMFELVLSCKPNDTVVYYSVRNYETGIIASGSISTDLPASNLQLGPQWGMGNNGDSAVNFFAAVSFIAIQDI